MERKHDAWLVDLDGTLYRAPAVKLAMAGELAIGGWSALPVLRRFRSEHERLRHTQDAPAENPFRLQLERTAAALHEDPDRVAQYVREWMFERPGKWLWRFRRADLLLELARFRAAGGRLAVVSDYPARAKLRALRCAELFDVVIANGETGGPPWLKPHPAGLLRASAELAVPPERCLVLGDRADADGQAARRAGMAFRRIG